ncbi:helix-turn-helix domain-containing protein [Klebsiella spallanzanii]|uniref:helix-turn-helix domain-containing protein n=1 Tax=Klebsiella spallanzanii TaxID=2587528 RepID=UPI00111A7148|nr:helix-turn-helix domain-containing protein [Klebsiella spallanzanii]
MKLLDSSEVCELLGISKSTLYRWCGVSDENSLSLGLPSHPVGRKTYMNQSRTDINSLIRRASGDEIPTDFPRPFKIGRAYKWKDTEVMEWLETRRV